MRHQNYLHFCTKKVPLSVFLVLVMLCGNASAAYHWDRQKGSDIDDNDWDDDEKFYECGNYIVNSSEYYQMGCDDTDSVCKRVCKEVLV